MNDRGFVLVATLWTLVVVFMLVAALDDSVQLELDAAIETRAGIEGHADLVATEAVLKFLLASARRTTGGFVVRPENVEDIVDQEGFVDRRSVGGELAADGRPYRGFGDVVFSLQDEGGLLALNSGEELPLRTFLGNAGYDPSAVRQMLDVLADYRDGDDFARLRGAERRAYAANGLAPPRNDFLRSPLEVLRVLHWRDEDWNPDWFSERRLVALNFNTMPAELLPYFFRDAAEQLIIERNREPFLRPARIRQYLVGGDRWSEEFFLYIPGDRQRLTIGVGAQCVTIALELRPLNLLAPLRERYRYESSCDRFVNLREQPSTISSGVFQRLRAIVENA